MNEPTRDDIDALIAPATPHDTYQLRAREFDLVLAGAGLKRF